eukprot:186335-Pyramimonas_sp.AAC.1
MSSPLEVSSEGHTSRSSAAHLYPCTFSTSHCSLQVVERRQGARRGAYLSRLESCATSSLTKPERWDSIVGATKSSSDTLVSLFQSLSFALPCRLSLKWSILPGPVKGASSSEDAFARAITLLTCTDARCASHDNQSTRALDGLICRRGA